MHEMSGIMTWLINKMKWAQWSGLTCLRRLFLADLRIKRILVLGCSDDNQASFICSALNAWKSFSFYTKNVLGRLDIFMSISHYAVRVGILWLRESHYTLVWAHWSRWMIKYSSLLKLCNVSGQNPTPWKIGYSYQVSRDACTRLNLILVLCYNMYNDQGVLSCRKLVGSSIFCNFSYFAWRNSFLTLFQSLRNIFLNAVPVTERTSPDYVIVSIDSEK